MQCPSCHADDDFIVDSRPLHDATSIRRRRECGVCHTRFTTYETYEAVPTPPDAATVAAQLREMARVVEGW
jgi:transcriptional repressor NrdR